MDGPHTRNRDRRLRSRAGAQARGLSQSAGKERVCLIVLGCAKNQVDAERMAHSLLEAGFRFTPDPRQADVLILSTCSFIQDAVRESLSTARQLARYKRDGSCRSLVVTGCLVQRFGRDLFERIPEADLFAGLSAADRIGPILARHLQAGSPKSMVLRPPSDGKDTQPAPSEQRLVRASWAYVKISEGCSNRCSYCTLPGIRGPLRSRSKEEILKEVRRLAESGVVEFNLVAQDVAAYGHDRGGRSSLALVRLLDGMERIDSLRWIRLLYCHPAHVGGELVQAMGRMEKLCPYLDLPIQHASDRMLEAMGRPYKRSDLLRLIERLREVRPDIALRTTVMVGFPGETKRDFDALLRFLEEVRFHHVGVFCFSPEAGTSAVRFSNRVTREESLKRRKEVFSLQGSISRRILSGYVGTAQEILIEVLHAPGRRSLRGRTRYQAPEVDGVVLLSRVRNLPSIPVVQARIVRARTHDLLGEILPESLAPSEAPRHAQADRPTCRF